MTKVYMVPGYGHAPGDRRHGPERPDGHFPQWETGILKGIQTERFAWYSGLKFWDLPKAWRAGYWDTYKWAYDDLALQAARQMIRVIEPGSYVLAHSLGSRAVLEAIRLRPDLFDRVAFIQGSVTVDDAMQVIYGNPDIKFLNIALRTDQVLSIFGRWFAPDPGPDRVIGNGIKVRPSHLEQVILDDTHDQARMLARYGVRPVGDNPDSVGDHEVGFRYAENWPVVRDFLTAPTVANAVRGAI